jgi:hypothetical protein
MGDQGDQDGQDDPGPRVRLDDVRGASEAEELAGALDRMADDIELGRSRERGALRATADLQRAHPDVVVEVALPASDVMVSGSEAGLRLALDNLLTMLDSSAGGGRAVLELANAPPEVT